MPQAIKVAQSAINAQSGHTSCSSNSAAAAADDIKAHSFILHRESANWIVHLNIFIVQTSFDLSEAVATIHRSPFSTCFPTMPFVNREQSSRKQKIFSFPLLCIWKQISALWMTGRVCVCSVFLVYAAFHRKPIDGQSYRCATLSSFLVTGLAL